METPNPYLRKLGFSDTDRVVILHADDIGMCQATVTAYADLLACGWLSSAAVMVPCGWFPAAAACYRESGHYPQRDMGVHLTLTSEWSGYRWRPISGAGPESGLVDEAGYFHSLAAPVQAQAQEAAVERELRAQIDTALRAGIDLTHMDTHMLTLFDQRLLPIYLRLGLEYRLPAFVVRGDAADWEADGYSAHEAAERAAVTQAAEAQGMPLCDSFHVLSLDTHEGRLEEAAQALAECPPGITHFALHPTRDTAEVRGMSWDWQSRVADHALFTNPDWGKAIADSGVKVIGYRALRDAFRAELGAAA